MFFAETWLDEARLMNLRDKLGFGDTFGVSRVTRGGGMALFWKKGCRFVGGEFLTKLY